MPPDRSDDLTVEAFVVRRPAEISEAWPAGRVARCLFSTPVRSGEIGVFGFTTFGTSGVFTINPFQVKGIVGLFYVLVNRGR